MYVWKETLFHTLKLGPESKIAAASKLLQGGLSLSSLSLFEKVLEAKDSGKMCKHTEVYKPFRTSVTYLWILTVLRPSGRLVDDLIFHEVERERE